MKPKFDWSKHYSELQKPDVRCSLSLSISPLLRLQHATMNEAQSNASAWPDPPFLYKRYTADNLDKLHNARKKGAFPDTPISQPLYPDFSLKALEPPPPPTESYTIFDQRWQVHESLQSLSDLGVRQLFPEGNIGKCHYHAAHLALVFMLYYKRSYPRTQET